MYTHMYTCHWSLLNAFFVLTTVPAGGWCSVVQAGCGNKKSMNIVCTVLLVFQCPCKNKFVVMGW